MYEINLRITFKDIVGKSYTEWLFYDIVKILHQ
jgi:hypothetical protein